MKRAKSGFAPLGLASWLAGVLVFALFFSVFENPTIQAGDWPEILGPQPQWPGRGEKLPDSLPAKPKIAWRAKVGSGYGGPVVVGKKVVVFHRVGKQELVEALDAANWPTAVEGGI